MDAARYQRFVSLLMESKPPEAIAVDIHPVPEMPGVLSVHAQFTEGRHSIQPITTRLIEDARSLPAVVAEVWRRLSSLAMPDPAPVPDSRDEWATPPSGAFRRTD